MKLLRLGQLTFLHLLISGCAFIHSLDENLPQQVQAWIQNQDYGKALDTLYYIQRDNKNYKTLMIQKERIIRMAQRFEKEILLQGERYLRREQWHKADETYEYGLDKLPDSRALRKAHNEFIKKRSIYLKQLQLKVLQNKVRWLISDSKIRKEMTRVTPKNYSTHWMLQDHMLDTDSTARTLIECVTDSIHSSELDIARQCLNIAEQLSPSAYYQQRVIEVTTQLEQAVEIHSRKLSKRGGKTLRSARMALARGNFKQAHQEIKTLPEQDRKNGRVLKFKDSLNEQTEDYVDKTVIEGRQLYSQGKVQEAYLLWKSLQSLAPDNERLQRLIQRAEKILRKLHSIDKQQNIVVPPNMQN